jgi:sugar transferase (PEP-CTERM system associated)
MSKTLIILLVGDFLLAILTNSCFLLAGIQSGDGEISTAGVLSLSAFASVPVLTTYFSGLYSDEKGFEIKEILLRIAASLSAAYILLLLIFHLFRWPAVTPESLLLVLTVFGVFQFIWHNRFFLLLRIPGVARKVLVLGVGPQALNIEKMLWETNHNFVLAGFIQLAGEASVIPAAHILGQGEDLVETAIRERIHKIVVSLSERRGVLPVRDVLKCKLHGIAVVDGLSFYEQVTGKLMIENINPSWFIFSDGFRMSPFMHFYKRGFDLLFALFGILISLPLLPLLALLIRLDSPGPVLFRQARVGEKDRHFTLYKFRTMREDAERLTGAVWAQQDDPRVTGVGRIVRKTRLDELPQLFNVLKGDMSFVGPRPERPEFVDGLMEKIPYYSSRHCVKPGITGWAQVRYPYGASEEDALEKLRYDLYYIKNYSLWLEFLIILETVKVVLFAKGGR